MLRRLGLLLVFLVIFFAGFWVVAAPFAVGIKLIWWNEPISARADIFLGIVGLFGGAAISFVATRYLALKWKE